VIDFQQLTAKLNTVILNKIVVGGLYRLPEARCARPFYNKGFPQYFWMLSRFDEKNGVAPRIFFSASENCF
jgi:hypothetical protein